MKPENLSQSVLIKFCKHTMITYYLYLRDHDNELLSGKTAEMQILESNWVKIVEKDIIKYNMSTIDIYRHKNNHRNKDFCSNVNQYISHERLKK